MVLVSRSTLTSTLNQACLVCRKAHTVRAVEVVKITSNQHGFLIQATNLDTTYSTVLPSLEGIPSVEGSVCVSPFQLAKLVKSLPRHQREVLIDVTKNGFVVEHTSIQNGLELADYPVIPSPRDQDCATLPLPEDFKKRLAHVLPAVSSEMVRYALTGILFDLRAGLMVASDGRRLHLTALDATLDVPSLILPSRPFNIINPTSLLIPLEENATNAYLQGPEGTVGVRVIEGSFPDYRAVIPDKFTTQVVVEREELLHALNQALPATNDRAPACEFSFNHALTIKTKNQDATYTREIPASRDGKSISLHFNPAYVRQAVQGLKGELVLLSLIDSKHPMRVDTPDDPGLAVIMPLDMQST